MKNSAITVKNTGLNPTRTGIIDVMKKMKAKIKIKNPRTINGEPLGDILTMSSRLIGAHIGGAIIPRLIDEIPVIAVMAAFASGKTIISGSAELRVKETDRIKTVVENLKRIGAAVEEKKDGMVIYGNAGKPFKHAGIDSYGDHRIAMSFSVASLVSESGILIRGTECVNTSFPGFFGILQSLGGAK